MIAMIPELISQDVGAVRLKMTQRLRATFERFKVSFNRTDNWPPEIVLRKSARIEPYTSFFTGFAFTMGALSYNDARIPDVYEVEMGRYCSIAPGTSVMGERHPMERVTTSSFTYIPLRGGHPAMEWAARDFGPYRGKPNTFSAGVTRIGHDVWIGADVKIKPGVSIGTGSVVLTGSVITKDVVPYAIVGGNPGRVIRMRFPENIVDRLFRVQWWQYSPRVLSDYDFENPERFLEQIEQGCPQSYRPNTLTWDILRSELVAT